MTVPRGNPIYGERSAKPVWAHSTGDVMDGYFPVLPDETGLDEFRERPENRGAGSPTSGDRRRADRLRAADQRTYFAGGGQAGDPTQ